ncbi:MAG: hypothetical protein U9Q98_05905 [Bacteroidota bacterium]|nr:hypothetical protein [Bacteroidota bacterium]
MNGYILFNTFNNNIMESFNEKYKKRSDELIFLKRDSQELVNIFSNVKRKKAKRMGKYYANYANKHLTT